MANSNSTAKSALHTLRDDYPWVQVPVIASAPMRLIAGVDLTVAVSKAGGIGFLAGGTDINGLAEQLQQVKPLTQTLPTRAGLLPIGLGFITWGAPLDDSIKLIKEHKPSAVWLFAPPSTPSGLVDWVQKTRDASPESRVWIQVGTVADALAVTESCAPDVLVLQGQDAGGHGQFAAASIVSLIPEAVDALANTDLGGKRAPVLIAAGGIMEARGAAAAYALGATGVVLGTRLLGASEAIVPEGYRQAVFRSKDGGASTVRSTLYDTLRGTLGWPVAYGGRGVTNQSWVDAQEGVQIEKNIEAYKIAEKEGTKGWGLEKIADGEGYKGDVKIGRMTAYAGTGVGLVNKEEPAEIIIQEVRNGIGKVLAGVNDVLST